MMLNSVTTGFNSGCGTKESKTRKTNELHLAMPEAQTEIMPGVKWGNYCQLYTPAFWKYMYLMQENSRKSNTNQHKLGDCVIEEIVACLLGGYGMPSELGILAFERLRDESLIKRKIEFEKLRKALVTPFKLANGSFKTYRFYNQKSGFIHEFLNRDDLDSIPIENDILFRNWLLTVKGIGPKTASWITRNWLQSENVAILDIHILRAGKIAGFFKHADVTRKYFDLEKSFIDFCAALNVLPSNMDAIMWLYMKETNRIALRVISNA